MEISCIESSRWLGVVVLYYPDEKVKDNIFSYLEVLDALIVWDNTPLSDSITSNHEYLDDPKIIKMGKGRNVGIGLALNEAINYARTYKFTHLLTMDQDSIFLFGNALKYRLLVDSRFELREAICTPNYKINDQQWYILNEDIEQISSFMTSGTLFPISIFEQLGMFRADFFVDSIDWEFAMRSIKNGIPLYALHAIVLIHGAGYQKKKRKLLWKTVFPNEYSPIRSYYMIRNAVIVFREYPDPQKRRAYFYYWFYKRILFVILYESNKFNKLKGLLIGYYHGLKGVVGEQCLFKLK